MKKNLLKILSIFILGIFGGIFADQIFWPYFIEKPLFYKYRLEQSPVYVTERKEVTIEENIALQDAVEKTEKIVVGIKTRLNSGKVLEGSGFIVTADGLIVTLNELIPKGSVFTFFIDGKQVSYQILKRDQEINLALIKIEKNNLPTLAFADSDKTKLGERVFLIGTLFQGININSTVEEGIISSFNEDFLNTNILGSNLLNGSPLLNIKGEILGINTIDPAGKVITIPIAKIKQFLNI